MTARRVTGSTLHPDRRFFDLLLVLLAALAQPLLVRMLSDYHYGLALYLPSLMMVVLICLVSPDPRLPPVTIAAIYGVEIPRVILGTEPGPSIVGALMEGQWRLLGVPIAALALGYATVLARRHRPLWSTRIRSNLRILARRPIRFVCIYRWALVVLVAGITLDTLTTMRTLYEFGPVAEVHPAMRTAVKEYGVTLGVPIGSVIRFAVVVFVAAIWRRWCRCLLLTCGGLYTLAAASNYFRWL